MSHALQSIQQKLALVKQKDPELLGLKGETSHGYGLNPCLSETDIQNFEHCYNIVLPNDYRDFLLHIGNGGAGPDYGLLSLEDAIRELHEGMIEIPDNYTDRNQRANFIADKFERGDIDYNVLSKTFPLTNADADVAIKERLNPNRSPGYFINMDYPLCGSLPICDHGCAWMSVLVITGEQRGKMWFAGDYWLPEYSDEQPTQMDFYCWYQSWLDDLINRI